MARRRTRLFEDIEEVAAYPVMEALDLGPSAQETATLGDMSQLVHALTVPLVDADDMADIALGKGAGGKSVKGDVVLGKIAVDADQGADRDIRVRTDHDADCSRHHPHPVEKVLLGPCPNRSSAWKGESTV